MSDVEGKEAKIEDEKIRRKKYQIIKKEDDELSEEFFKFVKDAAEEVAKNFSYDQIIKAVNSIGFKGLEVYGFLQLQYPYKWRKLLAAGIFDKACYFANKNFIPEKITVFDKFDIKRYVKSPVIFKEELRYRNYPERPFRRAVFYAEKPLREHIRWINNYKLYINGYPSNVILGKVFLVLMGWALPDFPQILVSFTPRQNAAVFEAQMSGADLKDDTISLLEKIVFYYRKESKVNEMAVIEAQMETERYEKKWSNLLDKMIVNVDDDPSPHFDGQNMRRNATSNRTYAIIIAILTVIALISLIFNFVG